MTTYWCEPNAAAASVASASEASATGPTTTDGIGLCASDMEAHALRQRLIEWNLDLFAGLLRDIAAHRTTTHRTKQKSLLSVPVVDIGSHENPRNEVVECIALSSSEYRDTVRKSANVVLGPAVLMQLRSFITSIAGLYIANSFHNFEHAAHVVMSTKKLFDRISERQKEAKESSRSPISNALNGVMNDPLTQFAIIFAALIHDVDHQGVSNSQLVSEENPLALSYAGKSVAEQNSIDVAWSLLMQPEYEDLRCSIYGSEAEYKRFRQIVVNAVLCTDLFDQDLKLLREVRWNKSFGASASSSDCKSPLATIVIELIIQASDVSHTMQHFTIYKKWNMRLLEEMYEAYRCGRTAKNPLEGWYEGELWFFDNYVIPLARKLRECNVFGVACDEFLDYANDNRLEWEAKGQSIVREATKALKSRKRTATESYEI
jgi:3'5'-cyclic nucleotide phosphodiesterase